MTLDKLTDASLTAFMISSSPLDVPAVATTITKDDILSTIREIRERG